MEFILFRYRSFYNIGKNFNTTVGNKSDKKNDNVGRGEKEMKSKEPKGKETDRAVNNKWRHHHHGENLFYCLNNT